MKMNLVINNIVLKQIKFTPTVKHRFDKINKNSLKGDLNVSNWREINLIRLRNLNVTTSGTHFSYLHPTSMNCEVYKIDSWKGKWM